MKRFLLISIVLIQTLFSQRVVGYYPHWVFNNFAPEDIDLDVVTHVIHAFAWPNADGSIDSYDGMFGSGISEVIHAQDRKFILSLGGWGNDSNFEIICADPNLREFFINRPYEP
jgi:GH18 family chitinase